MRENIDVWDQSDFKRGLNDMFNQYGGGQYATTIALSFHRLTADCCAAATATW
jgi:hypothetical protein